MNHAAPEHEPTPATAVRVHALEFPHADGAGPATADPAAATEMATGRPGRQRPIGLMLIGVLVLAAAWTIGVALYFDNLGAARAWAATGPAGGGVPAAVDRLPFAVVALATLGFVALAGLALFDRLVRPIRRLTQRADELAVRFAGRAAVPAGTEIDRLVASFDAMARALLAHGARAQQAYLNELQNGLELQRRYALVRLLRSLDAAADDAAGIDQIGERALQEIGEYLDWPLGRVLVLGAEGAAHRSIWRATDPARYAAFVAASEAAPVRRTASGLIGRAYVSGLPHWVSDLTRLDGWSRAAPAAACRLQTGFVIPVIAGGAVAAFIEFFSEHRVDATPEMLELVEAISTELWRQGERLRAAQALRAGAADTRRRCQVAGALDAGVIVTGPDRRIEWANAALSLLAGQGLGALRGRDPLEVLGAGLPAAAVEPLAALLRDGRGTAVVDLPLPGAASDGSPACFEIEIQPLADPAGGDEGQLIVVREVTARRRAELALRERAGYFASLFDDAPLPALIQGDDLRVLRANRAALAYFGRDANQVEGLDPLALLHPDDVAAELAARRECAAPAAPATRVSEHRYQRGDGTVVCARAHSTAIVAADGTGHCLTLFDDLTADAASARTLRESRDRAEQANRAKSQFLANMSHEIRTPMNGMLGMTELLLATGLSDKQRRFADAAHRSGEALLGIINDVLDFSKIEAGKLALESLDFNLETLVEDLFDVLATRADEKQIELAYWIDPAVPHQLRGDPNRLRQILANLVGNALKFTERGEVVLTVALAAGAAPDGAWRVRFEVRDSGIGMRPEALARLFTVYMQAEQAVTRRYGGTGLGLAISKQLVELMNGTICARSRPGEGSTFAFEVPLAAAALPAPAPAPVAELAGKRVVIVEDNPTNRGILDRQLAACGLECATAENASQALELMRAAARAARPFEVAIVDMKMPGMSGRQLAAAVRADPLLAAMRVVLLTALADVDELRLGPAGGVDIALPKPVRHRDLVASLARVLVPSDRAPVARSTASIAGARILLVEDNPVNQEVVRALLADLRCDVRIANDGRRALEALERERFDLVLMDCQMPEMDGFETARRIRDPEYVHHRLGAARAIPIIALTATSLPGDAARCRAAGFSDYLTKPFRPAQLEDIIARWLADRAAVVAPVLPAAAAVPDDAVRAAAPLVAPAVDATVIDRIRDMERRGAANLLARLIETFIASSAGLMHDAAEAIAVAAPERLASAMHTLKSSSANLGADALARRCATLESLARARRIAELDAEWDAAAADYDRLLVALRQLAPEPAPPDGDCAAAGAALPLGIGGGSLQ